MDTKIFVSAWYGTSRLRASYSTSRLRAIQYLTFAIQYRDLKVQLDGVLIFLIEE